MGRLGSGIQVSASIQIVAHHVGRLRLGLRLGSGPDVVGRLGSGPRVVERLGSRACRLADGRWWKGRNVLHYVKRKGELCGRVKCPGNMSEGENVLYTLVAIHVTGVTALHVQQPERYILPVW